MNIQKSFLTSLDISTGGLRPFFRQEYSRTASGVTLSKELGDPLWYAEYSTTPMLLDDAMDLEAQLLQLNGSQGFIRLWDVRRPTPKNWNGSDDLTATTIQAIHDDNRTIDLAGTFQDLSIGDMFEISISSKRFLHKVSDIDTSSAEGDDITVWPHINPSVSSGQSITLNKPAGWFIIDPDSVNTPVVSVQDTTKQATLNFTAIQYLGAV